MALISEGREYSSPSKRIRLDQTQHLSNSNVELDFGAFSAPLKNVHEVIEGEYTVSAEELKNGDSGFNEMAPDRSTSQTGTSVEGTSTHSSKKSDDGGTANSSRDDDRDEVSSTVSYLSDISGLSELSAQEWKPMAGPMSWVQRQMIIGVNPRSLLSKLVTDGTQIPQQIDDLTIGRRRNSLEESSWEDRHSDPCATDCSRDSHSVRPSHHVSADCSSQDSIVSGRLDQCSSSIRNSTDSSYSPFQGAAQMLNIESSEADSMQMSTDSGMGMSAADSSCSVFKERHMSVDSSTHDSGVGFSADSPTDVGSSHLHVLVDSTKDYRRPATTSTYTSFNNPTSSNSGTFVHSTKDCDLSVSSVDSSTAVKESVMLVESSGMPADLSMGGKLSSMVVDSTTDSNSGKNTDVSSTDSNCSLVVHRHMSVDSVRDSGIGDGSNSVGSSSEVITKKCHMSVDSSDDHPKSDDVDGLRMCWQPKIRETLAARLLENTYFLLAPNRYIFPGAEVYYDPDDEQSSYSSSSSSSHSSESANNSSAEESDNEDVEEGEYWDDVASAVPDKPVNGRCP